MESQMQRPAHQHIEHDDVGLHSGESNQTGEKKSVMKKVKDKAKKLKNTLKKPVQGQGQEHEYRYDENVDEEDDDDEEIGNDREIHGASPTQDSTVIGSRDVPTQLDQDPEQQADTLGDRIDPMQKGEAKARPNIPAQTGYQQEEPSENKHFPSPMNPDSEHKKENAGEPDFKFGPSTGMEEDPQAPQSGPGDASNYESKVHDPTGDGGKEAVVGNLVSRFDNLNVGNESETKRDTGSHDQFNPESNPLTTLDNPESIPKSFDSDNTEGMPRDTVTGKASSATSGLTDKAIAAKNAVASKLGYGGGSGQEGRSPSDKPESESTPGYTQKITETLNPVYEKVAGAGSAVMSKFQRSGDAGNQGGVPGQEGLSPASKTESESAPSYTQKITDTLNPVYGKVAGAGSAVMSKFQRSGDAGNQGGVPGQEGLSPASKTESESAPGYTQKITDTLNPVYEKVAGAGTAVMSKFQGGGEAGNQGGVSSKDYWSEKLKPGDEDKALSESITDALHKRKEGYFQKSGEEKPTSNVTESEDVATRLGTGVEGKREGEDALDAGRQSSGPGVVGRVKDAVGSWIGKGSGTQTAQDSINESYVDHAGGQGKSQE